MYYIAGMDDFLGLADLGAVKVDLTDCNTLHDLVVKNMNMYLDPTSVGKTKQNKQKNFNLRLKQYNTCMAKKGQTPNTFDLESGTETGPNPHGSAKFPEGSAGQPTAGASAAPAGPSMAQQLLATAAQGAQSLAQQYAGGAGGGAPATSFSPGAGEGMSSTTKIAIGAGAALILGGIAYFALSGKKSAPATGVKKAVATRRRYTPRRKAFRRKSSRRVYRARRHNPRRSHGARRRAKRAAGVSRLFRDMKRDKLFN